LFASSHVQTAIKRQSIMAMTVKGLGALAMGKWLSDGGRKGAGRLLATKLKTGSVVFYFRYTKPDGTRDTLPLGSFDPEGAAGLKLHQASKKANELSRRYQSGDRDLRAILEAEEQERAREREMQRRTDEALRAKANATLGALLTAYGEWLERSGKASARLVKGALIRHVEKPWPNLWMTPAADITTDDLLTIVARVADMAKLREASKLRSYLRAAYASAIRARQSAQGLPALRELKIAHNPASDLVTIEGASKPRERVLSVAELRFYWKRISAIPDAPGAMLRFHLLTGGQRIVQLGRLTITDYDADSQSVRIQDLKGKRAIPRPHDVPLIPAAQEALQIMRGDAGPYLFTLTNGFSPAGYASLRDHVAAVRSAMQECGELELGWFTPGDIRRTVETRLAAEGWSKDVRAQLQSHGLGGVQDRHYDKHDYLAEKREAIETLFSVLNGSGARVTPIRRKRGQG
jgi:hypothetical protein